jgi:hypothetical protein
MHPGLHGGLHFHCFDLLTLASLLRSRVLERNIYRSGEEKLIRMGHGVLTCYLIPLSFPFALWKSS